ncbi:hypothetical protein NL676_012569 [Syzygium grande]|nr:hypothetical protein NL676_012569 [Syzygium grande]
MMAVVAGVALAKVHHGLLYPTRQLMIDGRTFVFPTEGRKEFKKGGEGRRNQEDAQGARSLTGFAKIESEDEAGFLRRRARSGRVTNTIVAVVMKRSFDLELRLQPYSVSDFLASSSSVSSAESAECSPEEQRKLTVFYDGKVCASTVTELQARAIILLANREMEERSSKTPTGSEPSTPSLRSQPSTPSLRSQPSTPSLQAQVYNSTGLSMKRSLQRFLQKRQHRIQATSPYHHQY